MAFFDSSMPKKELIVQHFQLKEEDFHIKNNRESKISNWKKLEHRKKKRLKNWCFSAPVRDGRFQSLKKNIAIIKKKLIIKA